MTTTSTTIRTVIRTLIVDDETIARRRLRQFLDMEGDIEIVGECENGGQACASIRDLAPDLVFLDVEMPVKNGFEVVQSIGANLMPVTVFVTAYDHYACNAFEVDAIDYLLKPFDQQRFKKALLKARENLGLRAQQKIPSAASSNKDVRFLVKQGESQVLIKAEDVLYVSADGNYVQLHTVEGSYRLRERMLGMLERLDIKDFRRIHRSTIANLNYVKKLLPWFGGDYLVMMSDGTRLTLSRNFREAIREFV